MPLGYLRDDQAYAVIASAAGLPSNPAWYRNLERRPEAMIEVGSEKLEVRAATGEERARLWERIVELAPGYRDYQEKTERQRGLSKLYWLKRLYFSKQRR